MFVLAPLKQPPVALLWSGQVVSSIGDELHRVALAWIAVGLLGRSAAYVTAAQSAVIVTLGLCGGVLADRWDPRRTMIGAELARAAVAMVLPVAAMAGTIEAWQLYASAIGLSLFAVLFSPALQVSLSRLAETPDMLFAINGLVDGTRRLARIIGPGIVGALMLIIPLHHFFTVNAVTFLVSAATIAALGRRIGWRREEIPAAGVAAGGVLIETRHAVAFVMGHRLLRSYLAGVVLSTAGWVAVFYLCLPLYLQATRGSDVGAFGLIIAAYGVANLSANLVLASRRIEWPGRTMYLGRLLMGAGFIGMALPWDWSLVLASAALAGTGGPMGELPFLVLLRHDVPRGMVGTVYSLRPIADGLGTLLGMLTAPWLLGWLGNADLIEAWGVVVVLLGVFGLWRFGGWRLSVDGRRPSA
jgi:MFS family permease